MKKRIQIKQGRYFLIRSQFVARHAIFSKAYYCERFLFQFNRYLSPICELVAYRLSDEGFVLLVKARSAQSFADYFIKKKIHQGVEPDSIDLPHYVFACALKNLLISMAMHLNKREDRKGGLFKGRYEREEVMDWELGDVIKWIERDGKVKEHEGKWKRVVRGFWGNVWFRSHMGLGVGRKGVDLFRKLRTLLKITRFYHYIEFHLPFLTPT